MPIACKKLHAPRLIAVNERGYRIGQDNPNAKLTDHEGELVFELREEGWTYQRIADKLEVSKSLVRNILKGLCRTQYAARHKFAE